MERFYSKEIVDIAGIYILNDRIRFDKKEILFEELDIKKYKYHFMIFSKADNYKNKMLYYMQDKDAVILLNVLINILNNEQHREKEISDRTV